jgi:hypothetical protein
VLENNLDWGLIGVGVAIGAALVVIDAVLRRGGRYSLPPLAVGMAIYLPSSLILPTVAGAVLGWLYDRWVKGGRNAQTAVRLGILTASGLIVGESLFNVALSGVIAGTDNAAPLAFLGATPLGTSGLDGWAGLIGYIVVLAALYVWTKQRADKVTPNSEPDLPPIEAVR